MIGEMLGTELLIKNPFQLSGLCQKFNSHNSVHISVKVSMEVKTMVLRQIKQKH